MSSFEYVSQYPDVTTESSSMFESLILNLENDYHEDLHPKTINALCNDVCYIVTHFQGSRRNQKFAELQNKDQKTNEVISFLVSRLAKFDRPAPQTSTNAPYPNNFQKLGVPDRLNSNRNFPLSKRSFCYAKGLLGGDGRTRKLIPDKKAPHLFTVERTLWVAEKTSMGQYVWRGRSLLDKIDVLKLLRFLYDPDEICPQSIYINTGTHGDEGRGAFESKSGELADPRIQNEIFEMICHLPPRSICDSAYLPIAVGAAGTHNGSYYPFYADHIIDTQCSGAKFYAFGQGLKCPLKFYFTGEIPPMRTLKNSTTEDFDSYIPYQSMPEKEELKDEGKWIGIDFGQIFCRVGAWNNGKVEIFSHNGSTSIPSCVAFSEERLVGMEAKNQATRNAERTIFNVKNYLGADLQSAEQESSRKCYPVKINSNPMGYPCFQVAVGRKYKIYAPEDIITMIIAHLKEIAEAQLKSKVSHAVINVPDSFNRDQRKLLKAAALRAKLPFVRLYSETTAAVLGHLYLTGNLTGSEKTFLVVNVGGGSTSVGIFIIEEGMIEVKSGGSIPSLGGEEFESRVFSYFVEVFKSKHNGLDLTRDPKAVRRLRSACEGVVKSLSSCNNARVELEYLFSGIDFFESISRSTFEDICNNLFRGLVDLVDKVIRGARISKGDIEEVVLAGGSSRIPKVRQMLGDYFGGKNIFSTSVNIDEAVVYGTSLYSGVMGMEPSKLLEDVILMDVIPSSVGVEVASGSMAAIIKKHTAIPSKKSKIFTTSVDNQTSVVIKAFEGDRALSKNNIYIGKLVLDRITSAKKGIPRIEISFDIDANGILRLKATEVGTSNSAEVTFDEYHILETVSGSSVAGGEIVLVPTEES